MAKNQEDALQCVEQILPFFTPAYTLTINAVPAMGIKDDFPLILESLTYEDDYEGDFSSRRILLYTLRFTAKTYLFGSIADTSDGLIRKVQADVYTETNTKTAKREVRYTAVPNPITAEPGDDFGFTEEWTFLPDSKNYSPTRKEDI